MLKRVFKDGVIYSIPDFLQRGIGLLLVPFYTKVFSPTDYGIIDIFTVVGSIIFLTVAVEISQSIARFYPDIEDLHEKRSYASTAFVFTIFSYSLFGSIILFFPDFFGKLILENQYYLRLFNFAILSILVDGITKFLLIQVRYQLRSKLYATINIIKILVFAATVVYFVLIEKVGVIGTFYAGLIASSLAFALTFAFSFKDYSLTFSRKKLVELLKFSIPIVPSSIAVFFSLFTDRIMIKEMATLSDLGLYGIAFRFASIIILVVGGFRTALTPLIYKYYKKNSTREELAKLMNIFIFICGTMVGLLFLFPKEILQYLTSPEYLSAWSIIGILAASIVISNLYIFTPGASIAKKTIHLLVANIIGATLNIILNYFSIPIFGLVGASCSTLLSAIFVFLYYYITSQKLYFIPFNTKQILTFILVLLLFVYVSYLMNTLLVSTFSLLLYKLVFYLFFIGTSLLVLVKDWKIYYNNLREFLMSKLYNS